VVDSASVELRAARFRALGEPTRLRILELLSDGPTCVCTLRHRTETSGPLMSHHLSVLRAAGLVTSTRHGRWVDYQLASGVLEALASSLVLDRVGVGP